MTTHQRVRPTPGYNNPIPDEIMTPATVETRIGTLEFFDGFPTDETTRKVYDNLDFLRGVEVFLNFIPAANLEGLRRGFASLGVTTPSRMVIFDQLLDSDPLFLTGNTETVYASTFLDLERDGPTVVEVPPGCGPGTVDDAYFRFVVDMGAPGPDRGQGGKYLILPADYQGEVPSGYFEARSPSYVNILVLRGFLVDGKPDAATKNFQDGVKVYPLTQAENPPPMHFISGSKKPFNSIHANTYAYFEELAAVLAKEPIDFIDPELRGLAAGIGMRKDRPFAPDARMKAILTDAAAVGNATARAINFKNRDPEAAYYENSQWRALFVGGDYHWLRDGGVGGRNLDARTLYFYQATVNTPAMVMKRVGVGSQYIYTEHDKDGNYLDGATSYRLNVPANAPAKDFWSVVVYDPRTRSELQTSQPFPSKNSKRDALLVNADGSVDLYFGPEARREEQNWTQTVPGKGWYAMFRAYGPLEAWFDKSWKPGDFELVD